MSAKGLPHVFLDLDGTLAESLGLLRTAYDAFLRRYGRRGSDAEFGSLNGPTTPEVAERLRRTHRLPLSRSEACAAYVAQLSAGYLKVRPAAGAEALLASLKKRGHCLHLTTSSLKEIAGAWVCAQGWEDFFDTMTFGGETRKGKPDPAIYALSFAKAGLKPGDEKIVIEDSPNGCIAGKRAGAMVIRVGAGSSGAETGVGWSDAEIKSLAAVKAWFERGEWDRACYTVAVGRDIRVGLQRRPAGKLKDQLLCLQGIKESGRRLTFDGRYRPYWDFIGALKARKPHAPAMAVAGFTTVGTGDRRRYLVGLRSRQVAVYRAHWEWVPAGGIDGDAIRVDGSIDLKKMIGKEFEEETGLPRRWIRATRLFGAIRDRKTNTYDFCLHIELKAGADKAALAFPKKEYLRMRFLDARAIRRLQRSNEKIISAFDPMFQIFQCTRETKKDKRS